MNTPFIECSFDNIDVNTDTITKINGTTIPGGMTPVVVATTFPGFTVQPNSNGVNKLCCVRQYGISATLDYSNAGGAHTDTAVDFVAITILGGHPIHRPK